MIARFNTAAVSLSAVSALAKVDLMILLLATGTVAVAMHSLFCTAPAVALLP